MKRNAFALLTLLCFLFVTETNAQRRAYRYRYDHRPYVRVIPRVIVPRIVVPTPVIGFSWGCNPGVYVIPPPIIIGGGRGWRHYHRRGYDCNSHCHRWSDDRHYHEREHRYNDNRRNREYYDERERRYNEDERNRRYKDHDNYYNRLENNQQSAPKTYNTDEDTFAEEIETI